MSINGHKVLRYFHSSAWTSENFPEQNLKLIQWKLEVSETLLESLYAGVQQTGIFGKGFVGKGLLIESPDILICFLDKL